MKERLTFETWWDDFTYHYRNHKDGGREMLHRLKLEVQSFTTDKQEVFIDELLQRKNLEIFATELIPLFGNRRQIAEIKKEARKLIDNKHSNEALPEYLKVILKTYEPKDLDLLSTYYLNFQDTTGFTIPSLLFKIDKDLFLKAFTLYLKNFSVRDICDFDRFLYLTNNADSIEFLIDNLPSDQSLKLKSFAKIKSKHSLIIQDKDLSERLLKLGE